MVSITLGESLNFRNWIKSSVASRFSFSVPPPTWAPTVMQWLRRQANAAAANHDDHGRGGSGAGGQTKRGIDLCEFDRRTGDRIKTHSLD
jgi:hypothetical protein